MIIHPGTIGTDILNTRPRRYCGCVDVYQFVRAPHGFVGTCGVHDPSVQLALPFICMSTENRQHYLGCLVSKCYCFKMKPGSHGRKAIHHVPIPILNPVLVNTQAAGRGPARGKRPRQYHRS